MTKTATKTAGTAETLTSWDRSMKGQLCHAYAGKAGVTLAQAAESFSLWREIESEAKLYLHNTVPVCTNCQAEVAAIAWEAMGRLDTVHTEAAGQMIEQAKTQREPFLLELDGRGIKYDRISKGTK